MSGGIEEFIIQLGFDDSDAMKGYKDFLKKLNGLNSKVVNSINKVKKANAEASVASTKSGLEEIKVLQQQNQLRNKIAQAKKMGLDVSSEMKSLAAARKYNTLRQRTLELEQKISKERLKNATAPSVKPSQTTSPSPSSPSQVSLLNARESLRGATTQARKMGIDEKSLAMDIDSMTDVESIRMATVQTKKLINEVKELESVYARMDARSAAEMNDAKELAKVRQKGTQEALEYAEKIRKAKEKGDNDEQARLEATYKKMDQRSKQEANDFIKQASLRKKNTEDVLKEAESIRKVKQKEAQDESDRLERAYKNMEGRSQEEVNYRKRLAKERQKNTQEIIKESDKVRKAKKDNLEEIAAAQRKVFQDAEKRAERYQKQVDTIINQSKFRQLAKTDPDRAASLRGELQGFVGRSGNASMSPTDAANLDREFKSLRASVSDATVQLNRNGRAMLGLQTIQYGLRDSTRNLIRSYASMFAIFMGTSAINRVGQDFEAMNSAMLAAMGSTEAAQEQVQYLSDLTSKLGMSLRDTSDQYIKFTFAAKGKLDTEQSQELFTNMAQLGTVLGISKERMKLSFTAIQQMMNKSTVSSEELKRQLAESFPDAIGIFARSMNISEAEMFKMMEQGQILAKDVLPQVAKEMGRMANAGGALEQKLMTTRVQQGRFNNELERSGNLIFKSGFDEGLASLFNTLAEELSDGRKGLEGFGQMFKFVFETIGMTAKIVSPIIDSFMFVFGGLFSVINKINDVIGNNFITTLLALGGGFLALRKGISKLPLLGMFFKDAGDKADNAGKGVKKFGVIAGITLRGMFFWATLIVSALDEVFSLFTKDRVGLLEKYIFGKDTGFESWDDLVRYMTNTDMSQVGSNLGGAVFDGIVKALEMVAGYISGLGDAFATALFEIDWGTLANKFVLLLGQGILNILMLIPSFFSGFLNNMIEKATGVDLGLGDSLSDSRKGMNSYFNGVIERQGNILSTSPAATIGNNSINSPTNNTRSNTSNNVTNSVTVNYNAANENNFGNQGAIADDIAAKVQEALNQNFQAAELSNGG